MPIILLQILALVTLGASLAVLFWIDLKHGLLPDKILLPLAIVGMALLFVRPVAPITPLDGFIGATAGAGFLALFRWVASAIVGREAMGLGDVKFMGMAGLWVGWQGLNPLILGGALFSLLIAAVRHRLRQGHWHGFKQGMEIPLGPGLCLAMAVLIVLNLIGLHIGPTLLPL